MSAGFLAIAVLVAICVFLALDDIRRGAVWSLAAHVTFGALFTFTYLMRVIQ